eukprot:1711698-Pyramimonas_sp.AAC.1
MVGRGGYVMRSWASFGIPVELTWKIDLEFMWVSFGIHVGMVRTPCEPLQAWAAARWRTSSEACCERRTAPRQFALRIDTTRTERRGAPGWIRDVR